MKEQEQAPKTHYTSIHISQTAKDNADRIVAHETVRHIPPAGRRFCQVITAILTHVPEDILVNAVIQHYQDTQSSS